MLERAEPKIEASTSSSCSDDFRSIDVCMVTGAAGGTGRATAIAAAANGLTTAGPDIGVEEGNRARQMAANKGGCMKFLKVDLTRDEEAERANAEVANWGKIKSLGTGAGIQHTQFCGELSHGELRPHAAIDAAGSVPSHKTPHLKFEEELFRDRGHRSMC